MNALVLEGQGSSLEMIAAIEDDPELLSTGDTYVGLVVKSAGFVGHNDLWLERDQLRSFYGQLATLDQTLRGEGTLKSMSLGELELTIKSVSSRGHLAVVGKSGYWVRSENAEFWHSISFGFEFESSQLSLLLNHSWLKNYAA